MNSSPDIDLKRPRSAVLGAEQIRLLGLFLIFIIFLGVFISQALDLAESRSRKTANTIHFLNTDKALSDNDATRDEEQQTVQTEDHSELIEVSVFLAIKGQELKLAKVNRQIPKPANKKELVAKLLEQLQIAPDEENLEPTIPEGTELLSILIKDRILYLNLNGELARRGYLAPLKSYTTLQSLANTMTNLPFADKVKFLVADRERLTLQGHFDLKTLWSFDETVVYDM